MLGDIETQKIRELQGFPVNLYTEKESILNKMLLSRAGAMSLNPVIPKEANSKIDWFHCI